MVVSKLQKRAGFSFAVLLLGCVITRIFIELGFGTTASRKLLEWGTSVFDKMFELVTAQAESFQTESQLVIGAALVSGDGQGAGSYWNREPAALGSGATCVRNRGRVGYKHRSAIGVHGNVGLAARTGR